MEFWIEVIWWFGFIELWWVIINSPIVIMILSMSGIFLSAYLSIRNYYEKRKRENSIQLWQKVYEYFCEPTRRLEFIITHFTTKERKKPGNLLGSNVLIETNDLVTPRNSEEVAEITLKVYEYFSSLRTVLDSNKNFDEKMQRMCHAFMIFGIMGCRRHGTSKEGTIINNWKTEEYLNKTLEVFYPKEKIEKIEKEGNYKEIIRFMISKINKRANELKI